MSLGLWDLSLTSLGLNGLNISPVCLDIGVILHLSSQTSAVINHQ